MHPEAFGNLCKKTLESKFAIFWKDSLNDPKIGPDQLGHNKLRFYSQLKASFTPEVYFDKVRNRNQRAWLSRLRISAHRLAIETGRWTNPPTPPQDRVCKYCVSNSGVSRYDWKSQDNEIHFLLDCSLFSAKRACFLKKLECLIPNLLSMSKMDQVKTILCPTKPETTKLVNKFIGIMFQARTNIDQQDPNTQNLTYPTWDPGTPNPFTQIGNQSASEGSISSNDLSYCSGSDSE